MDKTAPPKLSVLLVTYNQERYVRQAIESVLMQKLNFDFEVVIADDFSTDSTLTIVKEYEAVHPNVRILPAQAHLGITRNYDRGFAACRGEYIAVIEGDDYWISPVRLALMSDFLDQHPECVFGFHRIIRHDQESNRAGVYPSFKTGNTIRLFSAHELAQGNFIGGFSTCMYRSEAIGKLDPRIWQMRIREWPFNIALARQGPVGYVPEILSVYRVHSGGIWSLKPPRQRATELREILDSYNEYLEFEFDVPFQAIKRSLHQVTEQTDIGLGSSFAYSSSRYAGLKRWARQFVPPVLWSVARNIYRDSGPDL